MRIEISSSGSGGSAVSELQSNLETYIGDAESVLSSFKTIKESTVGLNGGAGNLQGALENVDSRVQAEANKIQEAKAIQNRVNEFVSLASRVDQSVSEKVNRNKDELYRVNPWVKPTTSVDEEVPWYEQAWNWLCSASKKISDVTNTFLGYAKDTVAKAVDNAIAFYNENKKNICKVLIGVAAISIAVVVTVLTGGAAVPALIAMTKAALTAGLVSAAIGGSISAVSSLAKGEDFEEILTNAVKSSVDGFCSGFMWGGIFAAGSQIISSTLLPKTPDNLSSARNNGVQKAKEIEIEAIKNNNSQYDWSPAQKAEILRTGKFQGIDGCHILDASRYPRFADNPQNIILLPRWTQHFNIVHGGNWSNPSNWSGILETMPQFSYQIRHMKHLGAISNLFSSQALPIITGAGVGVATS